ncbi:MAG: hypothetical protein M3430_03900 [Acidobacteriota bacterium]|nr:hypothetical protein [Acidobacteriota bacterium]
MNGSDKDRLGNDQVVKQSEERAMERRDFLQTLVGGSLILLVPARLSAQVLKHGNSVAFRSLGHLRGPRYLDGRTHDGTVGLAPELSKKYSGTKWSVVRAGEGIIALKCLGLLEGPGRWLDGRTHDGTVGLAPHARKPFTGTIWEVVGADESNPNIVRLKCRGHAEGPRWLDGRTHDGTVWLAPKTDPPFTGTKWEVQGYPVRIDE